MKKFFLSLLLLACASPLFAQENIGWWVGRCEQDVSLDMTSIERKDPATGKVCRLIREIVLEEGHPLYGAFFAALAEDLSAAESVEKRRAAGAERIVSCRFFPPGTTERVSVLVEYPAPHCGENGSLLLLLRGIRLPALREPEMRACRCFVSGLTSRISRCPVAGPGPYKVLAVLLPPIIRSFDSARVSDCRKT